MDFQWVEMLIEDVRKSGFLEHYVLDNEISKIYTSKFVIYIYFPKVDRVCSADSLRTIHLDIDVLKNSYSKVLNRLRGLLGLGERIYARQTVVTRIEKEVAFNFLIENHLNGALHGKYRYGLFFKGDLVSVAVFSGGRVMHDISENYRSFELIRFCHKTDYLVVGGVSKLLKAFIKDFQPNDIMTYADRDWSQHSTLDLFGFKQEGVTNGQIFRVKNGVRLSYADKEENFDYIIKNKGSIKLKLYL